MIPHNVKAIPVFQCPLATPLPSAAPAPHLVLHAARRREARRLWRQGLPLVIACAARVARAQAVQGLQDAGVAVLGLWGRGRGVSVVPWTGGSQLNGELRLL